MCFHFSVRSITTGWHLIQPISIFTRVILRSVSGIISMANQNNTPLLTSLKKRERNLTYVGLLIATTEEKLNQGGLVLDFYILKHSTNSVVLQETVHNRDACVWKIFCGHEYFNE